LLVAAPAEAGQRVSIELVLAVDVSLSVNDIEYGLQMQGMASAFRDPEVLKLIAEHDHGIAVTMTQWTGTFEAAQPLPWRVLTDEASVLAFATAVASAPRSEFGNFTGIGHAITFAARLIETNNYEGDEKKIDISGDGRNNSGPEPRNTRLMALAHDITINGLAIIDSEPQLASYYSHEVIIGPASFVIMAKDFEAFAEAFKRKLKRELGPKVARLQ
jgi:Ca-activated chloride channel homolog